MIALPRFMVCAPRSGSGKTIATCALLRALQRAGRTPAAFKCGPDYIDPLFHRKVAGAVAGNLDAFFLDGEGLRRTLAQGSAGCDVAVLEGAMGYYDGFAPNEPGGSSYQVARETATPAVLVLDAHGASLSLAALVSGFASFLPEAGIEGVILNRLSESAFRYVAPAIEERTGIAVLGYLPENEAFALESRHLGLVTAMEVQGLQEQLDAMAEVAEATVDLDGLWELAVRAPALPSPPRTPVWEGSQCRLAVARDDAFCFYYAENLSLLESLGCELAFFSPLSDEALPEGACGLYLGGGYPELHARALSGNEPMRRAIRLACEAGLPMVAECGGFLYLQESLVDEEGRAWPMVGALTGESRREASLRHFGYIEVKTTCDGLYGPAGTAFKAHEFHYWRSSDEGACARATKPSGRRGWDCMHVTPSMVAGFPHVYYPANPQVARNFVAAMRSFGEGGSHGE